MPFDFACRNPARTLSTIKDRSNSATAPKTVKTILPIGVEVSTPSVVRDRSGEAVELPDGDDIKLASQLPAVGSFWMPLIRELL
jgi:hypothetical protein